MGRCGIVIPDPVSFSGSISFEERTSFCTEANERERVLSRTRASADSPEYLTNSCTPQTMQFSVSIVSSRVNTSFRHSISLSSTLRLKRVRSNSSISAPSFEQRTRSTSSSRIAEKSKGASTSCTSKPAVSSIDLTAIPAFSRNFPSINHTFPSSYRTIFLLRDR